MRSTLACTLTLNNQRLYQIVLLFSLAVNSAAAMEITVERDIHLADLSLSTSRTGGDANDSRQMKPQSKPQSLAKPLWDELTPSQKDTLSPLAIEWDNLSATQKKKWLAISNKYPSLKPIQKIRLQEQMRDWAKLTPAQRRAARESYSRAKKLDTQQKSSEWEEYQRLPEDQKKKLADEAAAKKRVTNLPPASQGKLK